MPVIDENTLITAQRLARLAETAEERALAQSAVKTADHELDLAFSGALRRLEAHPPVLGPEAQKIQDRLTASQKQLAADTDALNRLKARLSQAADADKAGLQDQIDLAQSQVEIDQDEVEEADNDLLQAGGNVHQRIQKAQEDHAAAERNAAAVPAETKPNALSMLHGMVGDIRGWLDLSRKRGWLNEAREDATASAARLADQRAKLQADIEGIRQRLAGDLQGRQSGEYSRTGAGACACRQQWQ